MPGLVGLITRLPRERAEAELLRMVAALRHETWYASGTWSDEALGLYVGWVERSESAARRMPLRSETSDLVLAFSGEEFSKDRTGGSRGQNREAVCDEFRHLVRIAEEEPNFPRSLNGRFHGVLANRRNGTVNLFNDRYGMGRIYYHEGGETFYFAAEAKAILAVRPELRSVDPDGLAEFISCGCTLENKTLFKKIGVLPPASSWVFEQASISRKETYFDAKEWEEQPLLDEESYYRQLRDVFSNCLPAYLEGPERVGISLTGGLDSRMIMAWSRAAPGGLPCYSFGGMYRDSQDVLIAGRVASACGQTYEVIRVGDELLAEFPHYSERTVFLTDGCVEVKHAPDLYVNERAREIAPVRITGNYGGEVLRQVRAFRPAEPLPGLYSSDTLDGMERAKGTYQGLLGGHPLSFAVFSQAPWHHYGLLSLEQSQLSLRSPFLDNEFVKTVFRAPRAALTSDSASLRLIADGSTELSRIRSDRGVGGSLPATLAAAQQAFLDFTFKAEYAYDYGMPQSIVRIDHALEKLRLERLFLGRHKFYHYRVWYRDTLASYIREMLLDSRSLSRPYLHRGAVESIVNGHLQGTHNYTTTIHKLLTVEHFHRLFIDSL
jgi:asparagine synthase (glutamine-hydrolysing)